MSPPRSKRAGLIIFGTGPFPKPLALFEFEGGPLWKRPASPGVSSYDMLGVAVSQADYFHAKAYLDKAITLEKMAAEEKDANLKASLERLAMAYRELADERAKRPGLSKPPKSD
jgi:hypothetical protein